MHSIVCSIVSACSLLNTFTFETPGLPITLHNDLRWLLLSDLSLYADSAFQQAVSGSLGRVAAFDSKNNDLSFLLCKSQRNLENPMETFWSSE